jgi:hypothetical protein
MGIWILQSILFSSSPDNSMAADGTPCKVVESTSDVEVEDSFDEVQDATCKGWLAVGV